MVEDPTGGATRFFAPAAQAFFGRSAPGWASGPPLAEIGGHQFYAPSGMGYFIDESSRKYFYLTDGTYSIVKTSSGLMVEKDSRGSELLKLRNEGNNKLPEVIVDIHWSACVTGKWWTIVMGRNT